MAGKHGKKTSGRNILLDIIIIILIGIIAFSGYKVFTIMRRYHQGTAVYNKVAEEAEVKPKKNKGLNLNWKKLKRKYQYINGWLYCKNTVINYPVAKYTDNSYYLNHLIDGTWNVKGTLFIDCNQQHPMKDFVTVIYGHHMFDGSMFGKLVKWRDEDYLEKHPTMIYSTPNHNYRLRIFAGLTIPSDSSLYKFDFQNDNERKAYLKKVFNESQISANVDVTIRDNIVMLSTCTYEFENARWVLFARADKID